MLFVHIYEVFSKNKDTLMNILIINQPPFNRGDESAHKGLVRTLLKRLPDAQIRVMSPVFYTESIRQYAVGEKRVKYIIDCAGWYHDTYNQWHGINLERLGLLKYRPGIHACKKDYEWADVVICAPGGICMGGFQDWNHLIHLKIAKLFKRPLVYYGRSFGPFPTETASNRAFKKLSLEMLHYFSFLSIRDHKSELLAKELGIPYISTVDSAFLDSPKAEVPYEVLQAIDGNPYMVFVPNYLLWHYAYKGRISHETVVDFYSKVMDTIWKNNPEFNIVMLPQLFGGEEYALRDIEFFRDLAKAKNDRRVIVCPDCYGSDIQQAIISKAKYVIGARYHSIVFALNQGIPCIALSYEHKISGLLETLGKIDWCVDFTKTLDSEINQAESLRQIGTIIPQMYPDLQTRDKAKSIATECMDKLVEYLRTL